MKALPAILMFVAMAIVGSAQNPVSAPVLPTAEEQTAFQNARRELQQKSEALATVVAKLPEAEALRKAQEAFDSAVKKLPEAAAKDAATVRVLDEAYRLLAKKGLSSREWEPRLSAKGDLEFHRNKP